MEYLEVAVPSPVPRAFTYHYEKELPSGTRVKVPFHGRTLIGFILRKADKRPTFKTKGVIEVLDETPLLSPDLLRMGYWMSDYYCHPIGEVLRTMLPASSKKITQKIWEFSEAKNVTSDPKFLFAQNHLFGRKSTLTHPVLLQKIKRLEGSEGWPFSAGANVLKELEKPGYIKKIENKDVNARRVTHKDEYSAFLSASEKPILNDEQAFAKERIVQGISGGEPPILLFGITGSGKTEVYMQSIEEVLKKDGQAILLVPEISLTPQMSGLFEARFPGLVALVHSGLSDDARWDILSLFRLGIVKILIGARSAVFAPDASLKLIIVDEEHDSSYKQTTGLNYHARDMAVLRAHIQNIGVVLGSATPSLESYYNAKMGRFQRINLTKRAKAQNLPNVEFNPSKGQSVLKVSDAIDSRIQFDHENGPISSPIVDAIAKVVQKGEQAIVIVNRRGYAACLLNVETNAYLMCPQCSVSLTVHGRHDELRCHYCFYRESMQSIRRKHPGATLMSLGCGSEQAEDFLKTVLPEVRMARLDSEVSEDREKLSEILSLFREKKLDVLIGTQLLAKGHDFPAVTLTAICDIDHMLKMPDFRAGERVFSLLVQAAGRSGRHTTRGDVILQLGPFRKKLIEKAIEQDYEGFAEMELAIRKRFGNPPFTKMIQIEISAIDGLMLDDFCHRVAAWMMYFGAQPAIRIIGPAPMPIEVLKGRHRRSILLRASTQNAMRGWLEAFLKEFEKRHESIRIKVNVDPMSLM